MLRKSKGVRVRTKPTTPLQRLQQKMAWDKCQLSSSCAQLRGLSIRHDARIVGTVTAIENILRELIDEKYDRMKQAILTGDDELPF